MTQKSAVLIAFVMGLILGALLLYLSMGFIGPPSFEQMRLVATAAALVPGVLIALYGLYRRFVEKYTSYHMRDVMLMGSMFLVLLPLVVWLGYPSVHAYVARNTEGWTWRCSSQGCGWVQERRSAPSKR